VFFLSLWCFFFLQDNDANHHIDWITSATNLRCKNYHIKETTRQKVRAGEEFVWPGR